MCKYRFLEDANVNGYLLDDLDEEEMTYQEVIKNQRELSRHPEIAQINRPPELIEAGRF